MFTPHVLFEEMSLDSGAITWRNQLERCNKMSIRERHYLKKYIIDILVICIGVNLLSPLFFIGAAVIHSYRILVITIYAILSVAIVIRFIVLAIRSKYNNNVTTYTKNPAVSLVAGFVLLSLCFVPYFTLALMIINFDFMRVQEDTLTHVYNYYVPIPVLSFGLVAVFYTRLKRNGVITGSGMR